MRAMRSSMRWITCVGRGDQLPECCMLYKMLRRVLHADVCIRQSTRAKQHSLALRTGSSCDRVHVHQ